jgi:sec-independent protein translocase protein TatB
MLDVSFTELALIAVVGFLILGPKEMPQLIRALATFLRQCREAIDECKAQLDAMAEESGAKEVIDTLETEKRYITDQFGDLREVYDVRDVVAQGQARVE